MDLKCCFKVCKNGPLNSGSAKVEVKSAIPSSGLRKHQGSLLVLWKNNGEAIFHPECWNTLLGLARKRGSSSRKRKSSPKSDSNDTVMYQIEKAMIKEASKTAERFDSERDIERSATKLVEMMKKSKRCVFFTGAGISTSAGLGDFRGKGGKWTEQDREAFDIDSLLDSTEDGKSGASPEKIPRTENVPELANSCDLLKTSGSASQNADNEEEEEEINYEELRPTYTHEAIGHLIKVGLVKYLISQNCDGLHLLSGVPQDKISELHGDVFVEKCEKCDKRYERSYYVCDDVCDMYLEELSDLGETNIIAPKFIKKCDKCELCHRTGRKCNKKCNGFLMDTIINFGDNLEEEILDKSYEEAYKCDLMVCLGTTLKVMPANELVDCIKEPQRIVICNRQKTDKDKECLKKDKKGCQLGVRVYGDCDVFMRFVLVKYLGQDGIDAFDKKLKGRADHYNTLRKACP